MQENMMKMGSILRRARETKEMTQVGLAEITGVTTRTIMDIENDKRFPTYEVFTKII